MEDSPIKNKQRRRSTTDPQLYPAHPAQAQERHRAFCYHMEGLPPSFDPRQPPDIQGSNGGREDEGWPVNNKQINQFDLRKLEQQLRVWKKLSIKLKTNLSEFPTLS